MLHSIIASPENRLFRVGFFPWLSITAGFNWLVWFAVFSLIFSGVLRASNAGAVVWKEQRGMLRAAEIGVVVWKEQSFHSDASSKAFAFDRMKQAGPIAWFYNGAKNKSFEKHELFQQIRFPQWPPGEIVAKEDFESLKFKLGELEAFANKYPNAAPLLMGMVGSIREAVAEFSSGKVFFSGDWISREEYQRLAGQRDNLLKKYAEEREVLEKQLHQEAQAAREAQQEAKAQQRSQWILAGGGVWLLLVLLSLLTRSWGTALLLIFALLGVAGWFTYTESGFGWTGDVERVVRGLPSLLPFTK